MLVAEQHLGGSMLVAADSYSPAISVRKHYLDATAAAGVSRKSGDADSGHELCESSPQLARHAVINRRIDGPADPLALPVQGHHTAKAPVGFPAAALRNSATFFAV
jgi:hypothetical protein